MTKKTGGISWSTSTTISKVEVDIGEINEEQLKVYVVLPIAVASKGLSHLILDLSIKVPSYSLTKIKSKINSSLTF